VERFIYPLNIPLCKTTFIRFKSVKASNGTCRTYLYKVKNTWIPELKSPRQKIIAYIGKTDLQTYDTKKIFERDSYKCKECNTAITDLTIDHIIPLSKGGTNDESNLQVLCKKCNLKKRNQINNTNNGGVK
jgi:5-methylcytosine-specific restriction endonuclease McrA